MKILFVSTEIWSEKNPEGIVARKIVLGLLENNCQVDVLTTNPTNIVGISQEFIVEDKSNEFLSKVRKKIVGVEKRGFVNMVRKIFSDYNFGVYDLIITRTEPFFLHEIGFFVKHKYPKVKWVASFGDPVFLNPYNSNSVIKKNVAKRLEQKYWKTADLVTHTNDSVIEQYVKFGFDDKKAVVLENPFLFVGEKVNNAHLTSTDIVKFAYIGSLYGRRSIRPVIDFLSKVDFNFELLIIGGVRNTYYENRFGSLTKVLMKRDIQKIMRPISDYHLKDKVKLMPFMNKVDLDQFITDNVDVLINIDAPIGNKNIFLSSKVVEYLQYQKPILNFSIEGASVDFLKSVGVKYYVDLRSRMCIKFTEDMIPDLVPSENIEYFTSKQVCKRLLDKINII